MYLSIKQHDLFRTLLMGFEIPFRSYIATKVVTNYNTSDDFKNELLVKNSTLSVSDPTFLRQNLPNACKTTNAEKMYKKFVIAYQNSDKEIIEIDQDIPMVGALNIVTFAFTTIFSDLYSVLGGYNIYCSLAEKYRYARNKLDHPGCKTLEETDLVPVLSFVKDICTILDDTYFSQKSKDNILSDITTLQKRKIDIPIPKNNFSSMPYTESKIVCREREVGLLKEFIYGSPEDLRKRHSCCIFGYGGVGKTALVLEVLKELVQDILDDHTANEYRPKYVFFFSAKKQRLEISSVTGKIFEKALHRQFETADELFNIISESLDKQTLRNFHDEGLIIIDNLEALSEDERKKVKSFIESKTPSEMQFLITSRNCEEYEQNIKLAGFEEESGINFVNSYVAENGLEIELTDQEITELLSLSKGNTLVLVLCLRRLSQHLSTISGLTSDFSSSNAWKNIRNTLNQFPNNAYEVVSEFMFKDTFEELEILFSENINLFYKILKIFAVYQQDGIDLNTICLLSKEAYPKIEAVTDTLCNYLILEKSREQYSLNDFAEKYIINRFMPDATTFEDLSFKIQQRERQVQQELSQLEQNLKNRPELSKILSDWHIKNDSDRIAAASMYRLYGNAAKECKNDSKIKIEVVLEDLIVKSKEMEEVTLHPYIKYQKARILQLIDKSKILSDLHTEEITSDFRNAIFIIKTVEQYAPIQQTKSYASLLWLYGQYLSDNCQLEEAIRYLEEGLRAFEDQNIKDQEYYQCLTKLGTIYLQFYTLDKCNRLKYLTLARQINNTLQGSFKRLGKAKGYAQQLNQELKKYIKIKS